MDMDKTCSATRNERISVWWLLFLSPLLSLASRRVAQDVWRALIYVSQRGQLLGPRSNNSCLTPELPRTPDLVIPIEGGCEGWGGGGVGVQFSMSTNKVEGDPPPEGRRIWEIGFLNFFSQANWTFLGGNSRFRSFHRAPLTSSVLVAEIWEAPHVAQPDDGTSNREEELHLVAPLAPLLHLILRVGSRVLGLLGPIGQAPRSVSFRAGKAGKRSRMSCFPGFFIAVK